MGLTVPFNGVALADHAELFRRAEAAGYDDLWSAETNGHDGFTPLAAAASGVKPSWPLVSALQRSS